LGSLVALVQRIVEESGNPVGFDSHAWSLEWLQNRVPALGGARPVDYMGTAVGRAFIYQMVLQMQTGAYS